jgi:hypothetical protein
MDLDSVKAILVVALGERREVLLDQTQCWVFKAWGLHTVPPYTSTSSWSQEVEGL